MGNLPVAKPTEKNHLLLSHLSIANRPGSGLGLSVNSSSFCAGFLAGLILWRSYPVSTADGSLLVQQLDHVRKTAFSNSPYPPLPLTRLSWALAVGWLVDRDSNLELRKPLFSALWAVVSISIDCYPGQKETSLVKVVCVYGYGRKCFEGILTA